MLRDNRKRLDPSTAFELVAQGLGQVTHGVKITGPALVNPAEQLGGAKALFPQPLTKRGQAVQIEFQQIRTHGAEPTVDQAQLPP